MKTKIIIILLSVVTLLSLSAAPVMAAFNPFCTTDSSGKCISGPCKEQPNSPTCQQNAIQNGKTTNPALHTIHVAADIIALVAGAGAVVLIMYSAYQFATAGGTPGGQRAGDSPSKAREARATLTSSVVGLVIIALAWTIVTFVSDRLIKS